MNNIGASRQTNGDDRIACQHCHGTVEHEPWCVTQDPRVHYAFEIVHEASKITLGDALILHSLGVEWADGR